MKRILFACVMTVACAAGNGWAQVQVQVDKAWVRGTVPAQKSTGAFMTLKSDKPVSLLSAESSAAKLVEIHEMKMDAGVMEMRAVPKVDVVPGKPTELKPGGYHIMLIDIVKPLAKGDKVPLTLEFRGADGKTWKQKLEAEVRDLTGR